jgi:hypothetical protein
VEEVYMGRRIGSGGLGGVGVVQIWIEVLSKRGEER